jgi:hypothetical protein
MNEYYREKFDRDLKQQFDFLKREKDLVWWQRYSPTINDMPARVTYPDMYNMMTKTLNVGDLEAVSEINPAYFEMFTIPDYDPFAAVNYQNLLIYDGGTYLNANPVLQPVNILYGSTYKNGTQIPPLAYSLNGGVYR